MKKINEIDTNISIHKKKIKEYKILAKKYNIDFSNIKKFIETTGSYPFLLGKPTPYLIKFLSGKKIQTIKNFHNSIFEEKNVTFKIIVSSIYRNKECDKCQKSVKHWVNIVQDGEEKVICFRCFTIDYLSHHLDIDKFELEDIISDLLLDKRNLRYEIVTMLPLIAIYEFFDEKDHKQISNPNLELLKAEIKNSRLKSTDVTLLTQGIQYIREYVRTMVLFTITNLAYNHLIKTPELFYNHEDFWKSKNTKKIIIEPEPLREVRSKIKFASKYFSNKVPEWILEQKWPGYNSLSRPSPGFIIEIIKETQKAILCKISLLNKLKPIQCWVPKSVLNNKDRMFYKIVLENFLKESGFF